MQRARVRERAQVVHEERRHPAHRGAGEHAERVEVARQGGDAEQVRAHVLEHRGDRVQPGVPVEQAQLRLFADPGVSALVVRREAEACVPGPSCTGTRR